MEALLNRSTIKPIMARVTIAALAGVVLLVALTVQLQSKPAPWWDEGWTLTVARTWVETGFYGRLQAGTPAPPGMSAAFPVVAVVALGFKLFGVGVWQGRLMVGVLFTLGSLAVYYSLVRRLYSRKIAWGTLAVLLFMMPHLTTNPLYMGRQVLAEPPMLFFLLAGYLAFYLGLTRSPWFVVIAASLWGIANVIKAQPKPFWLISLVIPLLICLVRKQRKAALLIVVGIVGGLAGEWGIKTAQNLALQGHTIAREPLEGLTVTLAIVPLMGNRIFALRLLLIAALPVVFGMIYAGWQYVHKLRASDMFTPTDLVTISLWALAGSWLSWHTALSIGWARYLYPATFLGAVFAAVLLHDLTDGYDAGTLVRNISRVVRKRRINAQSAGTILAFCLIVYSLPLTLAHLARFYMRPPADNLYATARYLNTQTEPDALIESYESELYFLLDRPYHYPPDQLNVTLNRRSNWGQAIPIGYDPLAVDPDYLVIGQAGASGKLYDSVLEQGTFHLIRQQGAYRIYKRVR